MQRKDKKHSGWYTPRVAPTMKYSVMHSQAYDPNEEYDDWEDWRDGMRYNPDDSHWRSEKMRPYWNIDRVKKMNNKLRKQFYIRKSKRYKQFIKAKRVSIIPGFI
jgi:hypothetical protein